MSPKITIHTAKINNVKKIVKQKEKILTDEEREIVEVMKVASNEIIAVETTNLPHYASVGSMLSQMNGVKNDTEASYSSTASTPSQTYSEPIRYDTVKPYGQATVATDYSMLGYIAGGVAVAGGVTAAAGGGGGGGSSSTTPTTQTTPITPPTPVADTTAPTFTSSGAATPIAENSTAGQVVYTAVVTDNVGVVSYTLGGADASLFTIDNTGKVKLIASPDYETKSSYTFSVIAKDAAGNSATKAVTLAVTDVNEAAASTDDAKTASPAATTTEYQATTTVSATNDIRIDGLVDGVKYTTDTTKSVELTYSFPWTTSSTASWSENYGSGENTATTHYGLNATQIAAAKLALATWANISNVTFREVDEASGEVGDIRFGFSSTVSDTNNWGWSYTPSQTSESSDIWIATNLDAYNSDFSITGVGYSALIHELGHTLGLKHCGAESSSDVGPFYDATHDNKLYSVMSYNTPVNNMWFDTTTNKWYYVMDQSPMIYDILAIQSLYGIDTSYKTGNDIYSYDNIAPFRTTIWDAGGVDTISVANSNRGSLVNLNEGEFSSIQTSRFYSENGISSTLDGSYNLGIAYGAIIENAIGGSGADILIGNQYQNTLTGGAGADTFIFKSAITGSNNDILTDFNHTDDTIKLDDAIFAKLVAGALSSDMFKSGVATDSNDYILYDKTTGYLSYDIDGNGNAGAFVFAELTNKPTNLDYTDFIVI